MAQIEYENSINLKNSKDMCLDRNSKSKSEVIATTLEKENGTKEIGCKQGIPYNDLRRKLNRNRGLESPPHLKSPTSNDNHESVTEDCRGAQRKRDNDLRNKLNRKGDHGTNDCCSDNWKRNVSLDRLNRTGQRSTSFSPLKSPLGRSKEMIIFDIDNSNSFRFTNHHMRSSPQTSSRRNKDYSDITHSSATSQKDSCSPRSILSSGCDNSRSKTVFSDIEKQKGTPVYSRTSRGKFRKSWSRRKLHLPSEDDCDDMSNGSAPVLAENDKKRMARKEKDILYGKNTEAYKLYIVVVPVQNRSKSQNVHPCTPDKHMKCSRRSWDTQVKFWKRKLHDWAAEYQRDGNVSCRNDDSEKTYSGATDSSLEHKSDEEEDYGMDTLEDSFDLSDTEKSVAMTDDDDESFLDSIDFAFMVTDQTEDSIKLYDA